MGVIVMLCRSAPTGGLKKNAKSLINRSVLWFVALGVCLSLVVLVVVHTCSATVFSQHSSTHTSSCFVCAVS